MVAIGLSQRSGKGTDRGEATFTSWWLARRRVVASRPRVETPACGGPIYRDANPGLTDFFDLGATTSGQPRFPELPELAAPGNTAGPRRASRPAQDVVEGSM